MVELEETIEKTNMAKQVDIAGILEYLPHRYPFLLVDRVTHLQAGKDIVAIKNVSLNEPFFNGHFPERPIMPGVLILEALAQAGGILGLETVGQGVSSDDKLYLFTGIDQVKFKKVVIPGDQLQLNVRLDKRRLNIFKFEAEARVDGQLACSAYISSMLKDVERD